MILGLAGMVVANAAVLLGAHATLRKIRTGVAELDAILFLLLRFLIIGTVVLAAGLTGTLRGSLLGIAGVVVLSILLACGEHRRLPPLRLPPIPRFVGILLGIIAVRLALQVWWFAPFAVDPVTYHLPKLSEWIREGRLVHAIGADPRETFPAGFELIETWWVVFLRHDLLIELAGVEFLVLGFVAVFALARRLGLQEPAAALAALLYILTPGVHLLAISCMNDTPVAVLIVATAALIQGRAHPALLLIPVGLGIGMKPTYAYALPGLLILGWFVRRAPPSRPDSPRAAALVAGIALAGGAFWYLRNAVVFGSPIYPVGQVSQLPGLPPVSENLVWAGRRFLRLFELGIYDRDEPYTSLLAQIPGWGIAVFAMGLPALVDRLRQETSYRALAGALLVSVSGVFLMCPPQFYVYRFVLFVPALFAVAIAGSLDVHPAFPRLARALTLFLLLGTVIPHDATMFLDRMTPQGWRERTSETDFKDVPEGEKVACLYGFNSYLYAAAAPDFRRPLAGIRDASTAEDLRDQLRRQGIRWLSSRGDPESPRLKSIVAQAERAGYLRRHGRELYRCTTP